MIQRPNYNDQIYHYGIKRRSGRYPWGSGDRPYQSENKRSFNNELGEYHKIKSSKSPTSYKVLNLVKMIPHHILATVIPGYALAYNAISINYMYKSNMDGKNYFKKEGDSSGACMLSYDKLIGGGHSIYYKVTNGNVTFYDGQSKEVMPYDVFALANPETFAYVRFDNLKLKDAITNTVVSVKRRKDW